MVRYLRVLMLLGSLVAPLTPAIAAQRAAPYRETPLPTFQTGNLDWAFERLKDIPEDYHDQGAICEQVARLKLQTGYPPSQYRIETGLKYMNEFHQTVGELDVVVVQEDDNQAVLVGEVKCWKNIGDALPEAKHQRTRFVDFMNSGRPIRLHPKPYRRWNLSSIRFDLKPRFILISQDEDRWSGPSHFDLTLGYTLNEMHQLRARMIECQLQGDCARPQL